ncbi:hypothetical protein [Sediminispirochaeta smaragdinae]|uniref:Uncharacterized protein n=1 Tax=Sediminispirochaeta smaragdinae (strain DSM 11293 / JCM 15392 / SEBR 4228) TaxID=573413 RepID=E1R2E4_SEDSS|nr:hypothetical protein [Sediminispirochaeta smaragdinae]ADK82504.1 hypothetical protein Spirs_3415 [Sediminispirochaeta smaragdinae DSM 11293]
MSISDRIGTLFEENPDRHSALRQVSVWLEREFDQHVWICSIFGKRWAYTVGSSEVLTGRNRWDLGSGWGLLADELRLSPEQWQELCLALAESLKERVVMQK